MAKKHICPKCGGREFYTAAHVMQEWLVDENGEYIATATECLEVTHEPSDDNIWVCTKCFSEGVIESEEDKPMSRDEYYALLKAAHERTDWHDRDSIHAYNEYARELRKQMAEEER